uniref:Peptidase MA-like domain-containing protein n=1 Tax=Streptomyces sp. NBC_00049 TaxID=2903617 RepID=A0AAU2JLP5_9ACTN
MTENGRRGSPIEHGFPHLETVRASVTALFRRLSADGIRSYATSLAPADAAFGADDDLHLGAQRVASAMVRALRLPDARMVIAFRPMEQAATVELAAGPEYFVEVSDRFRTHRRDLAAALSHEVTHVLLHRLGLGFPGTAENEILTDTAAAYLGVGWLLLDAYREDALTHQKFGYLTPEEYGYVLARRAALFGEDPSAWFTSPQAYEAYVRGRALAGRDSRRAPLSAAGRLARLRYVNDRRAEGMRNGGAPSRSAAYRFDRDASGPRVSFPCPVCGQRLRVPVRGRLTARCALCRTVLECDT